MNMNGSNELTFDERFLHGVYASALWLQRSFGGRGADCLPEFDATARQVWFKYPCEFCTDMLGVLRGAIAGDLPAVSADALQAAFLDAWRFHRDTRRAVLAAPDDKAVLQTFARSGEVAEKLRDGYGEGWENRGECFGLLKVGLREIDFALKTLEDSMFDAFSARA